MKVQTKILLALSAAILWPLLNPSATLAAPIPAGYDLLETDAGTTYQDFTLPADFFGPGSDPFDGRVYLKGVPFDSWDPDGPGPEPLYNGLRPTDTIVRRLGNAGPGYPDTVQIEIVELSLRSVAPFTVSWFGGMTFETWELIAEVHVDPASGSVVPPQSPGTMDLRLDHADGGSFDSTLPVEPNLIFRQVGGPGLIGPIPSPDPITLQVTGADWCHTANPLGFPAGQVVVEITGLTVNFFPGIMCENYFPWRDPAVSFSVDGGALNPNRPSASPLMPAPNPAEGLIQPDVRHLVPNDVYAVGIAPGAQGYASEGEIFQGAGDQLGASVNQSNVDRMSAALGIGPAPGGPPFMGPFLPNPPGATPAPAIPGVSGPPGSFGPPPGNTVGTLGLVPDDNVDALSYGRDSGNVLLFSVDPATTGMPGSDVRVEAVTFPLGPAAAPPFPTNPGGGDPGGEAAGDIFKSVQLPPFGRYGPLHFSNGRWITPAVLTINQITIDEWWLGLQAPALNGSSLNPPEDDLDGFELADTGDLVFGVDLVDNSTGTTPPDGIPDRHAFFSIDTASPSNGLVLGITTVTPDDILVTPPGGFAFGIFADGVVDFGLMANDDLDALALSDVAAMGMMDPFLDEALFSLHPGSPSVLVGPDGVPGSGDEVSAADVFYTDFSGVYKLYANSRTLGLLARDNLNALDIQPTALKPDPGPPPPPPPGKIKKLTGEAALLAAHGIRVPEKDPCRHWMTGPFDVEIFGFGIFNVILEGPAEVESGAWAFDPETAHSEIATEIISMDLQGMSPMGMVIATVGRERALDPSPGEITQITPGIDFPAESFFDVYMRLEIPSAGLVLTNIDPFQMLSTIDAIPPYGSTYNGPSTPPIVLYDPVGTPTGQIFTGSLQTWCQADVDCDDDDPCTADSCDVAIGECNHNPLPDSDGDGVCDVADNCAQVRNSGGQAPRVFGHEMFAVSKEEFCWFAPADILWIQGNLADVSIYGVNMMTPDAGVDCFMDPTPPLLPGDGFYYVVQDDCPAGSWQSSLGVEPDRDLMLP